MLQAAGDRPLFFKEDDVHPARTRETGVEAVLISAGDKMQAWRLPVKSFTIRKTADLVQCLKDKIVDVQMAVWSQCLNPGLMFMPKAVYVH